MPSYIAMPDNTGKFLMDGTINFVTDTVKLALLAGTYNPRPSAGTWNGASYWSVGTIIKSGSIFYECVVAGFSSGALPLFSTTPGALTQDNTVTWMSWGYLPPPQHDTWSQVSAHEISGTGYTAGGQAMTGKAITATNRTYTLSASGVTWSNATLTARFAVAYKVGTANSITDPLIAMVLLNDDNSDNITSSAALSILWGSAGIFTFNQRSI